MRPSNHCPATLKYRHEDEQIADFISKVSSFKMQDSSISSLNELRELKLPDNYRELSDQELAEWYNDNVIYPDKVRINKYYYEHYCFIKDIQMIFCTVFGRRMEYDGEVI